MRQNLIYYCTKFGYCSHRTFCHLLGRKCFVLGCLELPDSAGALAKVFIVVIEEIIAVEVADIVFAVVDLAGTAIAKVPQ